MPFKGFKYFIMLKLMLGVNGEPTERVRPKKTEKVGSQETKKSKYSYDV